MLSLLSFALTTLLLTGAPSAAVQDDAPLDAAREALDDDRPQAAVELLADWLAREEGNAAVLAVFGTALAAVGREDEAAHQLARALARGTLDRREERAASRLLQRLDPHAREAERLAEDVVETLLEVAEDLEEGGHDVRALALAERLRPHALEERSADGLDALIEELRARREEVQLDEGADAPAEDEDVLPLVTHESEHYLFECNLEPSVVERLAATMDQVYGFYVDVWFGGDDARVVDRKATVRIHPDRGTMLSEWSDPTRAPGGWWSSGEWKVVCYDTRSDSGSLDPMLETLFHEASHQFMTMITASGGSAPAWLNEGTATFFEGALAMADGRVLWPDVARGRLLSVAVMLREGQGPTLREVIAYDEPGSYPADHYAFGWGLIYFLLEYEDPETLQRIWRPSYDDIVERASRGRSASWNLFADVVLAPDNPGGFESAEQFEAAWKHWVLEEVFPLNAGGFGNDEREERRRARLARYLEAAEAASADRKAEPSEQELLDRALGEVAALRLLLRERARPSEAGAVNDVLNAEAPLPDATAEAELLLLEADVLERRERDQSAAAALERALELSAEGRFALDDERREDLERRMLRLDRGNAPVRRMRLRTDALRKRTERLLSRYEREDDAWLLRARDLAELGATLLDDDALWSRAAALRLRAIEAGRIAPRSLRVRGEEWLSIFSGPEDHFEAGDGEVELYLPGRVAGRICTDLVLAPEYTVRAELVREGETFRSSFHGIVVAGTREGDWYAVGLGGGRELVVKRVERRGGGATRIRNVSKRPLDPALSELERLPLAVVVRTDGTLRITVADQAPVDVDLPTPLRPRASVGILVKDAGLTLHGLRVEFLP